MTRAFYLAIILSTFSQSASARGGHASSADFWTMISVAAILGIGYAFSRRK